MDLWFGLATHIYEFSHHKIIEYVELERTHMDH